MTPWVMGILAALMLGFLAGLITFRKAQQWCPECGRHLTCPDGHRHPGPTPAQA